MTQTARARPFLRVRGRSFVAVALAPEPPLAGWLAELDAQIARAPTFFVGRPVIVDLSGVASEAEPGLPGLFGELVGRGIRVIGTEGTDPAWTGPEAWGWPPPLPGARPSGPPEAEEAPEEEEKAEEPASLLLREPVRSGQTVFFPRGDVTVLGHVGSGAEVMAGGSIHVYGALRGRAIAGVAGNPGARIFCRRLEAELLAIDGFYRTADDLDPGLRGRAAQAWLEGDVIVVAALD